MSDELMDGYDPDIGEELRANDVPIWPVSGKSVTVTYSDTSAISFGQLPDGAIVVGVLAEVVTVLDGTVGTFQVGTGGNATKFADGDISDLKTAGVDGVVGSGSGGSAESGDATLEAKYSAGSDETKGEVRFTVLWVSQNEN